MIEGIIGGQKVGFIAHFDPEEYIKILRKVKPSVLFLGIGHYIKLSSYQASLILPNFVTLENKRFIMKIFKT